MKICIVCFTELGHFDAINMLRGDRTEKWCKKCFSEHFKRVDLTR